MAGGAAGFGLLLLVVVLSAAENDSSLDVILDTEIGDLDGGFSSFDSMLHWAIGHSDPAMLKEKANDIQTLSENQLRERQQEIKELMEKLKVPSDAELMKIAIDDLNNSSLSLKDRLRSLDELLNFADSVGNVNDLEKLGGLVAVVRELSNPEPEMRIASAWILGKASQNNVLVQNQIIALEALPKLMKMVKSSYTEEALKALYAISGLIRNNDNAQELFYSEGGSLLLQEILSKSSIDFRLHKKAALLVADLVDRWLEIGNSDIHVPLTSCFFLKSIVDLASSDDLDLQEKVLLAIRSLLQLNSTSIASDLKVECNLIVVLERMRERLELLMAEHDDERRDFARDVERLRGEVQTIFHRKLE